MKKLISIIIIATLFVPFWLLFFHYQIELSLIRKKVKFKILSNIDKSELVLLKFAKPEIKRILIWKHSKEFEYQSTMYDIVKSEYINDSVYYWCWLDKEETDLNIRFRKTINKSLERNSKANNINLKLINILSLNYFSNNQIIQFLSFEKRIKYNKNNNSIIQNIYVKPDTPPPQILT